MVAWRNFTIHKLQHDTPYTVTDEMNFPTNAAWQAALQQLDESQKKLIEAVTSFPENRLSEIVPQVENRYTFYTLLHGIIHHDLYHTGQIMLIKKALGGN
jgi:uncharacterized damage-inducible protein DinB